MKLKAEFSVDVCGSTIPCMFALKKEGGWSDGTPFLKPGYCALFNSFLHDKKVGVKQRRLARCEICKSVFDSPSTF
mgnify:CR=1 FL=1